MTCVLPVWMIMANASSTLLRSRIWHQRGNTTIQEGFTYRGERVKAITYKADFKYTDAKSGDTVIEDVKGKDMSTGKYLTTEAFRLKWKLLKQRYPEFVFKLF